MNNKKEENRKRWGGIRATILAIILYTMLFISLCGIINNIFITILLEVIFICFLSSSKKNKEVEED